MANRIIRIGASGQDVKDLQTSLHVLGFYQKPIDGAFGVETTKAVLAFQSANNLVQDGVVGAATWGILDSLRRESELTIDQHLTVQPKDAEDPGAPYLFFDLYPFDLDNPKTKEIEDPDFRKVFGKPNIRGGILKATDGMQYAYTDWFRRNFKALKDVAGKQYGKTWFRGAYHYLQLQQDGEGQADYYCSVVGNWDDGMILPIVDVEGGGERSANRRASKQQVIDSTFAFATKCKQITGKRVMLYGRSLMRDLGIVDKMNCDVVWNPSYTRSMVTNGITQIDGKPGLWALNQIGLWQYGGDGVGDPTVHKLPLEIVGFGKVDISVHVNGAEKSTLASLKAALL